MHKHSPIPLFIENTPVISKSCEFWYVILIVESFTDLIGSALINVERLFNTMVWL